MIFIEIRSIRKQKIWCYNVIGRVEGISSTANKIGEHGTFLIIKLFNLLVPTLEKEVFDTCLR